MTYEDALMFAALAPARHPDAVIHQVGPMRHVVAQEYEAGRWEVILSDATAQQPSVFLIAADQGTAEGVAETLREIALIDVVVSQWAAAEPF